jgi:hypothetical protein
VPITRWDELYTTRLDWAERAYADFLHAIDPEIARAFERKAEVTVVLYGRTQVGKTTLLLKVLGIAEPHFAQVSSVLRGKRGAGNSATATAMQYSRSPDQFWHLGHAQDKPLDDGALEETLADLRRRVEAGLHVSSEPVSILIPEQYFRDTAPEVDVRILDLPGTHSSNAIESAHVSRIAQRYVPNADIVLLVGRADKLGFLKPENLLLEELQYWAYSPDRFRIILTHTFSAQSTKDWVTASGVCDVTSVREYMLGQLRTHDYEIDDGVLKSIYPVEFGDSWEGLRRSGQDVFHIADKVVRELFDGLTQDILRTATKYARIRSAFNVRTAIKRKQHVDGRKLEARRELLLAKIEDANQCVELVCSRKKTHGDEMERYEHQIRSIPELLQQDLEMVVEILHESRYEIDCNADNTSEIKQFIANVKGELALQWGSLADGCMRGNALGEIPDKELDSCFKGISSTLRDYLLDTYWINENFRTDRKRAFNAQERAVKTLQEVASRRLLDFSEKESSRLKALALREKELCLEMERKEWSALEELSSAQKQLADFGTHMSDFTHESAEQLDRAQGFDRHLLTAFNSEVSRQLEQLTVSSSAVDKFAHLCFAVLLDEEYRKLGGGYEQD